MKTSLKAVAALLSLCTALAHADGIQTGTVTNLYVRAADGLIYFTLSGTPSGHPTCATGGFWVLKDENSNVGKQQFAMLLTARAQGSPITVWGAGVCKRWLDDEDVNLLFFPPAS